MYDTDKLQSETFSFLRFVLAVLVVFIHVPYSECTSGFSYHAYVFFSQGIARVAVPAFFLISGYLFCYGLERSWDWKLWGRKLRKRFTTLFIPYLLWNIIGVVYLILRLSYFSYPNVVDAISCWWGQNDGFYGLFWSGSNNMPNPFDYPLWFIRDLMIMVIISPILWCFVHIFKKWGIVLLTILYVFNLSIPVPGFSTESFLFFSAGLYFKRNGLNIIELCRKFEVLFYVLSIIFLIIDVYFGGKNLFVLRMFELCAVGATFSLASYYVQCPKYKPNKFLISSSFFIFAVHVLLMRTRILFDVPRNLLLKISGTFPGSTFLIYLASVVYVVLMCLAIYWIMRKFLPKTTSVLCGGR